MATDKELKEAVAEAVFNGLERVLCRELERDVRTGDCVVQIMDYGKKLEKQIRVKTANAGTHYYTIRVSEMF